MRALIVSDVHSNLEAFESVVNDASERGGFDEIWSLGDLIGYGPDPVACIELLRRHEHKAVAGNHDLASIGRLSLEAFNGYAAAANRWTAKQLTQEQVEYLSAQPLKLEMDEFTIVHGSPRDPIWEYVVSVQAAVASFMHFDTYWCLLGHSHIPFLCRPAENGAMFLNFPLDTPVRLGSDRLIINPGSVGQPRDGDPTASYAIYDAQAETLVHHRVEYDIPATQDKMRKHRLPAFLIERLEEGR
jgi:diadenosine tetraphosphatase ApaH/serine/threonine PP2A family protein phosphatase